MVTNNEIAKIFSYIAEILEMKNVPFKPHAYSRAAMSLESLDEEVSEIYKKGGRGALMKIPGVGKSWPNTWKN